MSIVYTAAMSAEDTETVGIIKKDRGIRFIFEELEVCVEGCDVAGAWANGIGHEENAIVLFDKSFEFGEVVGVKGMDGFTRDGGGFDDAVV